MEKRMHFSIAVVDVRTERFWKLLKYIQNENELYGQTLGLSSYKINQRASQRIASFGFHVHGSYTS